MTCRYKKQSYKHTHTDPKTCTNTHTKTPIQKTPHQKTDTIKHWEKNKKMRKKHLTLHHTTQKTARRENRCGTHHQIILCNSALSSHRKLLLTNR